MRRGRIFIYLALILIVGIGAAFLYFRSKGGLTPTAQPTPSVNTIEVIMAGQNIARGLQITEEMLTTLPIPETELSGVLITNMTEVVGRYAKYSIEQGVPITRSLISATSPLASNDGSPWGSLIPSGMTAVSIPITRLSSAAYGIQDGDYVNVIASFLLVDVDANYQSILPNATAGVLMPGGMSVLLGGGTQDAPAGALTISELLINMVAQSVSGGALAPQGRVEMDDNLAQALYVVPSEAQRSRLVTQMVMQNVQVLKVGTFPLAAEIAAAEQATSAEATATVEPQQVTPVVTVERPDIITLIVPSQDAVTLTYLMYSGAQLTLTLRAPGDTSRVATESATLQYLLNQYNISIPAKTPYAINPRVDELVQPDLPNDVVVVPPQ